MRVCRRRGNAGHTVYSSEKLARRRNEKGWSSDGLVQFRENVSRRGTLHILVLRERMFKGKENWEFAGKYEARWHQHQLTGDI